MERRLALRGERSELLRFTRCISDRVRVISCSNADRVFLIDETDWLAEFEYRLPDGSITRIRPCDHKWMANFGPTSDLPYARMQTHRNWHRVNVTLHRLIMLAPKGLLVDHRNRNSLDNRRSNLRFCNHSQNAANMRNKCKGTSQYLGVYRTKSGMWGASIQKDRKVYNLGHFATEREAAIAFNLKAIQLHGEFASLNEVPA